MGLTLVNKTLRITTYKYAYFSAFLNLLPYLHFHHQFQKFREAKWSDGVYYAKNLNAKKNDQGEYIFVFFGSKHSDHFLPNRVGAKFFLGNQFEDIGISNDLYH